ncbi:hypothetical protein DFH11DRAFT_936434 [Phellopilus nigrolimitatus]|nr:hypothetical protein DFH11DRAFT_936434 [Phellopilus nigrolimitatus]
MDLHLTLVALFCFSSNGCKVTDLAGPFLFFDLAKQIDSMRPCLPHHSSPTSNLRNVRAHRYPGQRPGCVRRGHLVGNVPLRTGLCILRILGSGLRDDLVRVLSLDSFLRPDSGTFTHSLFSAGAAGRALKSRASHTQCPRRAQQKTRRIVIGAGRSAVRANGYGGRLCEGRAL